MSEVDASPRKYALRRKQALEQERSSWLPEWKDVSNIIIPWRGRYATTDAGRNQHSSKTKNIYDSTATRAHGVLEAGLMAGNTSPARQWFRLKTPDDSLNEYHSVKLWLDDSVKVMRGVFARSNTYKMLRALYGELGGFGIGCAIMEQHQRETVHHNWLTAGEYCVAANDEGKVDTILREFPMTVEQVVKKFGIENVSTTLKNRWDRHDYNGYVDILHIIEPRHKRNPLSMMAKDKPFKSVYFESKGGEEKTLRESGYNKFPGLCPRWALATSTDVYSMSPASVALPHVKQLQQQQLRKAQAIDYMTKPPLVMPSSMVNQPYNTLPSGVTFSDDVNGGVRTAFEVKLNLEHLLRDIEDVRNQIEEAFFTDLFLMLANDDRSGTTAHEIALRHEEKLLMLGPMLESLYGEGLEPLVENTFLECLNAGLLPPIPKELEGVELSIEFVSTLAQAQRAVGVQSLDRVIGTIANIASFRPEAADKLDVDKAIDEYADAFGVDPSVIVANEDVVKIRDARAKAQAQREQMEALPGMASAMKDAAAANGGQMPALTGYGGTGL